MPRDRHLGAAGASVRKDAGVRVVATVAALLISYVIGTEVADAFLKDGFSLWRYLIDLAVGAVAAAATYTLFKDGPRSFAGVVRPRRQS